VAAAGLYLGDVVGLAEDAEDGAPGVVEVAGVLVADDRDVE
jgi:hypothetical protein